MTLTSLELALLASLALAIGAVAALALARRAPPAADAGLGADLAGRLDMMARTQEAAKAELAQQLQAQERALGEAVAKRLAELSGKVGESLERSAKDTSTTVTALRERLVQIDAAQKSLADLSGHVVGLRDILSNKQARGAFGEVMLEDLVRQVLPPSAYEFQATLGGGKRADCLLRLPNPPGPIVVDSKFPLEAWRAMAGAADEVQRRQAQRGFVIAIQKHILDIRDRYIVAGETAEAALMFLPSEAIYADLHANHDDLVQQSYRARVFIVSPTTLWATLNTVRAVLKDVQMREQASVIQVEVHKLLVDVERLDDRVDNLQKHFAQADKDIREIRISTDKVTGRAGRIKEIELGENRAAVGALAGPPAREI
ncbi:MAG: DNA recombination protein RmuC [Alphaproteobacteria bacterium]|nr:DNA recombination protein RmuC [Alphaproteobacteria bacterium]